MLGYRPKRKQNGATGKCRTIENDKLENDGMENDGPKMSVYKL